MTDTTSLAEKLTARFEDTLSGCLTNHNQITLVVSPSHLLTICEALRDEDDFSFIVFSFFFGGFGSELIEMAS